MNAKHPGIDNEKGIPREYMEEVLIHVTDSCRQWILISTPVYIVKKTRAWYQYHSNEIGYKYIS